MFFGIGLKDKFLFFRQMAEYIEAGVPYLKAMESLGRSPNAKIRKVMQIIAPKISEGVSFSEALSHFPRYFEPFIIQMVRAGEVGGSLEHRLKDIAEYLETIYKQQIKVILGLIYPVILINGAFLILPAVLIFTKGWGAYFQKAIIPLLILYAACIGIYLLYRLMASTPGIKEFIDLFLFYFPLLGWFFKARAAYRFMWILADLYEAGVDQGVAVKAAAEASGSWTAQEKFKRVITDLDEGKPLSASLTGTGLIPYDALELVHTGEETGKVPEMLKRAADMLGKKYNTAITAVTIIFPVFFYIGVAIYIGYAIITTFTDIMKPMDDIFPK